MLDTFGAPSWKHPLGTDDFGRDQLLRLLHGARVSLAVGFLAAAINMTIGMTLGAAAGYFGGRVDDAIVWAINTMRAVPTLFLLLIVSVLFRPSLVGLVVLIGLTSWPGVARLIRGQVLSLRERDYVLAARVLGGPPFRLILRHLLPNVVPIAIVFVGQDIGGLILTESGLSYLGFGVQPPTASWGNMLTNAQRYFFKAPWLV